MWTLTIQVRGQVAPVILQFTALERCTNMREALLGSQHGMHRIADDFGREFDGDRMMIDSCLMQDVDWAMEGDRAMQIKAAHSQAALQSEAQKDPILTAAMRMAQIANGGGLVRQ